MPGMICIVVPRELQDDYRNVAPTEDASEKATRTCADHEVYTMFGEKKQHKYTEMQQITSTAIQQAALRTTLIAL